MTTLKELFKYQEQRIRQEGKTVTDKFNKIAEFLPTIQELAEDNDCTVRVQYEDLDVQLIISGDYFAVAPINIERWKEVINSIDTMDIDSTEEGGISILLGIRDVFKVVGDK